MFLMSEGCVSGLFHTSRIVPSIDPTCGGPQAVVFIHDSKEDWGWLLPTHKSDTKVGNHFKKVAFQFGNSFWINPGDLFVGACHGEN